MSSRLGVRIQQGLDEKGMSKAELGRRIGLSRERIAQITLGNVKRPAREVLIGIARELDIPLPELYEAMSLTHQAYLDMGEDYFKQYPRTEAAVAHMLL